MDRKTIETHLETLTEEQLKELAGAVGGIDRRGGAAKLRAKLLELDPEDLAALLELEDDGEDDGEDGGDELDGGEEDDGDELDEDLEEVWLPEAGDEVRLLHRVHGRGNVLTSSPAEVVQVLEGERLVLTCPERNHGEEITVSRHVEGSPKPGWVAAPPDSDEDEDAEA